MTTTGTPNTTTLEINYNAIPLRAEDYPCLAAVWDNVWDAWANGEEFDYLGDEDPA